jgi:hypothetical protein
MQERADIGSGQILRPVDIFFASGQDSQEGETLINRMIVLGGTQADAAKESAGIMTKFQIAVSSA